VWVTAQAVAALKLQPLPIRHVPGRTRAATARVGATPRAAQPPVAGAGRRKTLPGRPASPPRGSARAASDVRTVTRLQPAAAEPRRAPEEKKKDKLPLALAIPVALAVGTIWRWRCAPGGGARARRGGELRVCSESAQPGR
jgi:hypothetical protein